MYRNSKKVGTITSPAFTDTGLRAATRYTYTLKATNSAGTSAASAQVRITTLRKGQTSTAQTIGRTYPSKKSAKLGRSGNSKVAKARSVRANSPAKFT